MRSTEAQDVVIDDRDAVVRRRRILIVAGAGVVALLVVIAWWLKGWATSDTSIAAARLRIATVTRGEFVSDVAAQATVVAAVSPTLYAPAAGTVTLSKRAGDGVHKGDLVATVDSPELRNEFERERAQLDSLSIDLRRQEIETYWPALDDLPTIVAGDFNEDPTGLAVQFLESKGLARVDTAGPTTWRYERSENGVKYEPLKMNIDHVMADASLSCRDGRVLDAGRSDHRPVVVTIEPR
jgi:hypothetical protein